MKGILKHIASIGLVSLGVGLFSNVAFAEGDGFSIADYVERELVACEDINKTRTDIEIPQITEGDIHSGEYNKKAERTVVISDGTILKFTFTDEDETCIDGVSVYGETGIEAELFKQEVMITYFALDTTYSADSAGYTESFLGIADLLVEFYKNGKSLNETINNVNISCFMDDSGAANVEFKIVEGTDIDNAEIENSKSIIRFRDYDWDTSFSEIVAKETENLTSGQYTSIKGVLFIKNGSVGGFDASIIYMGDGDKFIMGGYSLTEKHTSEIDYYNDYKSLVEKYKSVYGEPTGERENWKDSFYKSKPEKWGMAVIRGEVEFMTFWEDVNGAKVVLRLSGDNYKADTAIGYYCPDFETVGSSENTDGI